MVSKCVKHGDLEEENQQNETYIPCVLNVKNFASSYLFSIEVQHTIGFGGRYSNIIYIYFLKLFIQNSVAQMSSRKQYFNFFCQIPDRGMSGWNNPHLCSKHSWCHYSSLDGRNHLCKVHDSNESGSGKNSTKFLQKHI